jgi:hypothetical protein
MSISVIEVRRVVATRMITSDDALIAELIDRLPALSS